MAFSQFRKLSAQAFNTALNTWGANGTTGVDINTGIVSLVDYSLGGISTFTNPSGAISLSFTAGGGGDVSNCIWRFSGTITADTTVTTAAGDATTYLNGLYAWSNTTSGSFTLPLPPPNGSVVLPQGRRGILYVNNVNSVAPFIVAMAGSSTADPIPAGTVMVFYQNAAPAGWTIVASQNDKALRVVSSAGGVAGGTNSFSTVFTQSATGGYALQVADIPLHGHPFRLGATTSGNDFVNPTGGLAMSSIENVDYPAYTSTLSATKGQQIGGTGGGGSHAHSWTGSIQYADVIFCSRN